MDIKIIALNSRNEPYDLNFANIEEEIFFSYQPEPLNASLNLTGEERWILNFDDNNTSGQASDQVIQEIIGFDDPLPIIFNREGNRNVNFQVWNDFSSAGTSFMVLEDNVNFNLFKFPTEITGADFISQGGTANYSLPSSFTAQNYQWFVNGKEEGGNTQSLNLLFDTLVKASIKAFVTNGTMRKSYDFVTALAVGNAVFGQNYEGNVKEELMFFNKEGDNLNFELVEDENGQEHWEGDMIFHVNSNDTFKTIGLYTLEKVDPIAFQSENLNLRKLQLFNEFGFDFHPSYIDDEMLIDKIEIVNNQPGFYTKWIYANNIHLRIPVGSEVVLDNFYDVDVDYSIPETPILNIYNIIQDYNSFSTSGGVDLFTVIGNKRDAIMVITKTENITYNKTYGYGEYRLSNNAIVNVSQGRLRSLNLFKVVDSEKYNPEWNEPQYKYQLYDRKKLTIINSTYNDGVYTTNFLDDDESNQINSKIFKIECKNIGELVPDTDYGFRVKLDFRTNKIFLSSAAVDFFPASSIAFLNSKDFLVWESTLNNDFTPALIQKDRGFFFEQTDPVDTNLDNIFRTIEVGQAGNILTPQTTDEDGWKLTLLDYDSMENHKMTFIINEKSTYVIVEGVDFNKGVNLEETATSIALYFSQNVGEVSVISVGEEVLFWEIGNNTINLVVLNIPQLKIVSPFTWQNGALKENNPEYGVINDTWIVLDNSNYAGYIHHRVSQGNFHILNFTGVIPNELEAWYVLPLDKKIVHCEPTTTIEYRQNLVADSYLEDTTLFFEQPGDTKDPDVISEMLVNRFISNNSAGFSEYGLDLYVDNGSNFCVSRKHTVDSLDEEDDYIIVTLQQPKEVVYGTNATSGIPDFIDIASDIALQNIDYVQVLEQLTEEYNHNFGLYERPNSITELFERKIIVNDIDFSSGLTITINGLEYPVTYDDISIPGASPEEDIILDVEETLLDWGNQRFKLSQDIATPGDDSDIGKKYHVVLEEQGVLVWLEKSGDAIALGEERFDTLVIQSRFANNIISYDIKGTLDEHKILHTDVEIYEIGQQLTVTINSISYPIPFISTVDDTVSAWVDEYSETLFRQDIITEFKEGREGTSGTSGTSGSGFDISETAVLRFSTLEENTQLKLSVWVGKSPIIGRDLYKFNNFRKGNQGVIMSGNELIVSKVDLQTLGFSTAMIIALKNSKFALNNQEYNLIFVDPNILGLSYQGAFWNNDDFIGYNYLRSDFSFDFYDDAGVPPRIKFLTETIVVGHNIEDLNHNFNPQELIAIGDDTFTYIDYSTSGGILNSSAGFSDITDVRWNKYASTQGEGLMALDYVNSIAHTFRGTTLNYESSYDLKALISGSAQLTDVEFLKENAYLFLDETNNRIYLYNNDIDTVEVDFDMGGSFDPKNLTLLNVFNSQYNSIGVLCELSTDIKFYNVEDPVNGTSGNYTITYDSNLTIPFTPRKMISAQYYVYDANINDKHIIVIGDSDIAFIDRVNKTLVDDISFTNFIIDTELGYKNGELNYLYVLTLDGAFEIEIPTRIVKQTYSDENTYSSIGYNGEFDVVILSDNLNDRVLTIDGENFKKISYYSTGTSPTQIINNGFVKGGTEGDNDKIFIRNSDHTITVLVEDDSFVSGSTSGTAPASTSGSSGTSLDDLTIISREFLRYPRERFDGEDPIQFKFSWEEQDDEHKSIFYYDFSGDQLDENFRDEGVYQYTGKKPLLIDDTAFLNTDPNRDLKKVEDPKAQQSVFDELYYDLYLIDSETEIDPTPFPLQSFIGYRSDCEGVDNRTLNIHRLENIDLTITTRLKDDNNPDMGWIDIVEFDATQNDITIKNTDLNFVEAGFKKDQIINFIGRDILNEKNQATFKNAGLRGIITKVTVSRIVITPLNKDVKNESSLTTTRNILPPFRTRDAAMQIKITVEEELIAKIDIKGQTEIEDERFKVILNNFGKNIKHTDTFIFKDYDIKENGIDWVFLNQKRKEMLSVYPEIYNYLGSYKAVINAINYFGHNDLEFYEYYLNTDVNSLHYNKLHKIEIPDLFDNSADGFTPNDYILKSLPDERYQKTKLFNLTYRITDREGSIVLAYSLDEVITKLLGLKKWLQDETIPVGNRILDLTGRSETVGTTSIWHDVKRSTKIIANEDLTVIDFKAEAYLQPVENHSRTYNVHVEFFTNTEENIPEYFHLRIMTFKDKPNDSDNDFKLRAVQIINIYKTDMKAYNFAADQNTDPFILISCVTDNGFGATYSQTKTFSLLENKFI